MTGIPDVNRMTDAEILASAIAAARMSVNGFARDVLRIELHRVDAWLAGKRPMLAAVRAQCLLILERPALAAELARGQK